MRKQARSSVVIGYSRVSTEDQAQSGLGLADQRAAIAAEATRRGWSEIEYIVDDGYSAKSLARPGITEALERLSAGTAGILVVSKLDRLSRSLLDFASLMNRAESEGWQLVVLDMGVDTTTPSGALMANVLACFSEYERKIIGQRTSAALQQLKLQGKRLGRPRVMCNIISERIFNERSAGMTLTAIANGLNNDNVPTARGGKVWYPSTVRAVLKSVELDNEAA